SWPWRRRSRCGPPSRPSPLTKPMTRCADCAAARFTAPPSCFPPSPTRANPRANGGGLSMEWLILCLAVPAIVVPIVLLWGFVGCDLVFKLDIVEVLAPVNLVATPRSSTSVSLTWVPAGANAVRFEVERLDPGATDFVEVEHNATQPLFEDTNLIDG